jgi:hypothetical protein
VKKRVKRLGVIGGGLLCLREAVGAGGDEEKMSGVGSWNATRGAHGEENMTGSGPTNGRVLVYTQRLVIGWIATATRRHDVRRAGLKRETWDGRADKI